MSLRTVSAVVLSLALAPITVGAQILEAPPRLTPQRHTIGAAGIYGQPLGDFGQNVKRAFGLDGFGTLGLDPRGMFSLRAELGYQQYSSKSEPFVVSTGFGLYELESETKSGVLTLGVGPQIMAPPGPIRPYAAATIGFARFATETAINIPEDRSNTGQKETLDQQTVSSDFILSLAGTTGIAFEIPAFGRGLMLDLGARYHHNGRAKYVSSEGVQYNGTGRPIVTPTESEASFVVYRLGIMVPIK
jgi:hypothetical protein